MSVVVVIGCYLYYFHAHPITPNAEPWGQFGDFLGGVLNPIFGFLSMFALLVALVLQTVELRASKEELKAAREEQAKSAIALDSQNKAIQKQSFEQTFFSLLRLLGEVRDACSVHRLVPSSSGSKLAHKIEGVAAIQTRLADLFRFDRHAKVVPRNYRQEVSSGLLTIDAGEAADLRHYAKTVQAILGYLQELNIGRGEIYPNILRNQLAQPELLLLYFLCFGDGWGQLKSLVERYGVLVNLNPSLTGAGADYASFFNREAFSV